MLCCARARRYATLIDLDLSARAKGNPENSDYCDAIIYHRWTAQQSCSMLLLYYVLRIRGSAFSKQDHYLADKKS